MKKFIFLSLLLFVFKTEAQQSVTFKMQYLATHNYKSTMGMNMNCTLTLKGDSNIIEKLKSQGITQPISVAMKMRMAGGTKTGSTGANGTFPFTMKYNIDSLNINVSGKEIPMPAKANSEVSIYGHVGADGKLKADSLAGGKLKDTAEKKISQMMNSFQNVIKFPDHPLKIGDTFTQEMPFSIPMGGSNMATNSKVTYKLVSMAGGNAYFDVQQSVDLTVPIKSDSINLNGTGTGKLVYDIKNSFATDYKFNVILKFTGKINTLQIDGLAVLDMDYINVIN